MSIYKRLDIKSKINNYSVLFVNNIKDSLQLESGKKFFIIIDGRVVKYYHRELRNILKSYPHMILKATEALKTLDYAKVIIRRLIDTDIKKDYILVAIGGGIIQDISGFVASILYRGIKWIFFPTTLLAQCDSCIGSKTSINVDGYKNQVGNFYPPYKILLDLDFLNTLPKREIKSGMGEIIKVHLLDGKKSAEFITKNYDEALIDSDLMRKLIFRSLKIKKRIIERDEFDTGCRNIMNYGHTFGHALESLTQYKLSHGQAVTIGMDISNYLSLRLGYLSEDIYREMKNILIKNWPDCNFKNINLNNFFKGLSRDKKNINNKTSMILTHGPGKMVKKSFIMDDTMKKYISSYFYAVLKD